MCTQTGCVVKWRRPPGVVTNVLASSTPSTRIETDEAGIKIRQTCHMYDK